LDHVPEEGSEMAPVIGDYDSGARQARDFRNVRVVDAAPSYALAACRAQKMCPLVFGQLMDFKPGDDFLLQEP
jgi:hypothetical protein